MNYRRLRKMPLDSFADESRSLLDLAQKVILSVDFIYALSEELRKLGTFEDCFWERKILDKMGF